MNVSIKPRFDICRTGVLRLWGYPLQLCFMLVPSTMKTTDSETLVSQVAYALQMPRTDDGVKLRARRYGFR